MSQFQVIAIVVSALSSVVFLGVGIFLVFRMVNRSAGGGGGMAGLAQRFPAQAEPEGQVFTGQSVQVGVVTWKRCVKVCVSPQGLYLHARSVFASRPPVLIPWDEIKRFEKRTLFWQSAGLLGIGEPPVATITVLDPVLEAVRAHLKIRA